MVLIFSGETPSARISEEGARKTPNGGGDGSLPPVPPSLGDRKVVFTTSSSCGASPVSTGLLTDGDLETEPNKLRARPEPDRPQDQLGRYAALCPELRHHFQDLDSSEESSVGVVCSAAVEEGGRLISASRPHGERGPLTPAAPPESHTPHGGAEKLCIPEEPLKTTDFHCSSLRRRDVVARLLEKHRVRIPHHHDSGLYAAAAARTKSAAGCTLMAFPDFWGHVPPHAAEPMVARQPNTQRKKVLEDVRRIVCPDELIDRTVFDLEDPSPRVPEPADGLQFFSGFECGNLRKAVRVRRREYDLILNADANSCENHQWFYFEVSGMDSGACYRFNVINCEKPNSQFNYGMQPVLFSVRDALVDRPHWVRVGSDICYYRNHYCPRRGPKGSSYYTLTFSVIFKHSEDVCYLAYHYPYTYSALQTHLQILQESVDPQKIFYQQQSLCSTMGGNPCPVVTITACPASRSRTPLQQLRKSRRARVPTLRWRQEEQTDKLSPQ
ncbi:cytosolic carboxypeptidase 4-like [Arapaima gigas]